MGPRCLISVVILYLLALMFWAVYMGSLPSAGRSCLDVFYAVTCFCTPPTMSLSLTGSCAEVEQEKANCYHN